MSEALQAIKNIKTSRALTQQIFYSLTTNILIIIVPALKNSDIHRDRRFLTI